MIKQSALFLSLCLASVATTTTLAFTSPTCTGIASSSRCQRHSNTPLKAAGGEAPQYDKIYAVLKGTQVLGKGSVLLQIETTNPDTKLDYQPGHVIALEVEDTSEDMNDDTKKNGGWMRGPYTISRATEQSMDILIKVVGKKSKVLAEGNINDSNNKHNNNHLTVRFGGKFKVPILEGVAKDDVKQVVLLSTGVGVGPCVGAIEKALSKEEEMPFPPIALIPSFREEEEVVYREHLDKLAQENPSKFQWQPIVTSKTGRLSSSPETMKMVTDKIEGLSLQDTHYHLIGNGQMVNEWKGGLEKAGVPAERVTVELYFNSVAEKDEARIETIANAIASACSVAA